MSVITIDLAVGTLVAEGEDIEKDAEGNITPDANVWEKKDNGEWFKLTQSSLELILMGQAYVSNEDMVAVANQEDVKDDFHIISREQYTNMQQRKAEGIGY